MTNHIILINELPLLAKFRKKLDEYSMLLNQLEQDDKSWYFKMSIDNHIMKMNCLKKDILSLIRKYRYYQKLFNSRTLSYFENNYLHQKNIIDKKKAEGYVPTGTLSKTIWYLQEQKLNKHKAEWHLKKKYHTLPPIEAVFGKEEFDNLLSIKY